MTPVQQGKEIGLTVTAGGNQFTVDDAGPRGRLRPKMWFQAAALNRSARASTRSRVMSKGVRISHHGDTALRRRERNWKRALSAGTVGANGT
jgi:hypothetical protein